MILDATILAVDTAQVSGWAIWDDGDLVRHGQFDLLSADASDATAYVCDEALSIARDVRCPAVLVYERPFRGRGQGIYQGNWRSAWVQAGGVKTRTLGVLPATWRRGMKLGRRRADIRHNEAMRAQALAGCPVGPDAAAAILIGLWASGAPEVDRKLPKSRQRFVRTD